MFDRPATRTYQPFTWYWLADDGRVYSSARQIIVDETDADYQTFITAGIATPWPRDLNGDQTQQALQDVMTPYGLTVP